MKKREFTIEAEVRVEGVEYYSTIIKATNKKEAAKLFIKDLEQGYANPERTDIYDWELPPKVLVELL